MSTGTTLITLVYHSTRSLYTRMAEGALFATKESSSLTSPIGLHRRPIGLRSTNATTQEQITKRGSARIKAKVLNAHLNAQSPAKYAAILRMKVSDHTSPAFSTQFLTPPEKSQLSTKQSTDTTSSMRRKPITSFLLSSPLVARNMLCVLKFGRAESGHHPSSMALSKEFKANLLGSGENIRGTYVGVRKQKRPLVGAKGGGFTNGLLLTKKS